LLKHIIIVKIITITGKLKWPKQQSYVWDHSNWRGTLQLWINTTTGMVRCAETNTVQYYRSYDGLACNI